MRQRHARARIRVTLESDPMDVRRSMSRVLADLAPIEIPQVTLDNLELVLCEIVNNVVEHAYAQASGGSIEIMAAAGPSGIRCEITDAGDPMPDGVPPAGAPPDTDVDHGDLPEGGFGWSLIGELTKDFCYERRGDRNVLSFRLAIGEA